MENVPTPDLWLNQKSSNLRTGGLVPDAEIVGTSVCVPWPVIAGSGNPDSAVERRAQRRASSGLPRQRAKILIVDDEPSIADSLAEIVRGAGYEAVVAYTGAAAVAAADDFKPELLLADVLMPGMNGFEVALQLKQAHPACRLLLFSGQAATAALAQRFGRKFTDLGYHFTLLPKPIHPTTLLEKLLESLSQPG